MGTATLVAATLIAGLAVLSVIFVVGMRRKVPIVLNAVRRSGRAMKPLVLRSAGTADSPTSVVEHLGRTSGRRYETPVVATAVDGGFVIALPYGENTDWLKNVTTSGGARIRFAGDTLEVDRPEVVAIEQVDEGFAPKEQRLHRRFRVRQALLVHTTGVVIDQPIAPSPA